MSLKGIKNNKCLEEIPGTFWTTTLTQPSDLEADDNWTYEFDSTMIPAEFWTKCAVIVTPIVNTIDPIEYNMAIWTGRINVEGHKRIRVSIAHNGTNAYTIPAGTQYIVTLIALQ